MDKTRDHKRHSLENQKWLIIGGAFGLVSALAFDNKLIFGIGLFANLNGPIGFYPLWAVAVMPIFFYFSKRLAGNRALVAFFSGASFVLGIASIMLYTLELFGIGLAQVTIRVFS